MFINVFKIMNKLVLNLLKNYSTRLALIRRFSESNNKIKLILYTKSNCSLCDEAKEFIEDNYPNKFAIEEVDITKDRALFRKFKLDIPVFYHNGELLMQHKADKTKLDSLINK